MKKCPQCGREYDNSMMFCLDDGMELLYGPAAPDEPATAILPVGDQVGGGADIRGQIHTTKKTAVLPGRADAEPQPSLFGEKHSLSPNTAAKPLLIVAAAAVLLIGLLFGYRYFATVSSTQIESIAVMPFLNESENSDLEYLSDGLTESMITSLSQLPKLNVKARSSVFRYKGKVTDASVIGQELGVQAILNGRVVQKNDGLTLYLELVDASTGNRIWGEQYDRKTADLITLQTEVARDVSQKLRTKLSLSDEQKLRKNYTENVEAYQLYLKGRYHVFKLTPPEVQKSIEYFQGAIALDPTYALAYAGMSDSYRSLALAGEFDPNDTLPKAKAAALKAIDIDGEVADGHTALGVCLFWYDWNWAASEEQYKRALDLNPNSSLAHLFYSHLLSNLGRHAEALAEVKRARELDPLSAFVGALEGQFLLHAGKADEALNRLREATQLDPNFYFPHQFAAEAYIEKAMYAEAITEARLAQRFGPTQTVGITFEASALAKAGRQEEAREKLYELLRLSSQRFVPPAHVAFVYEALGETDNALDWLEKGFEARDPKMAFLKAWPAWNKLRAHPRFQELARKMAFP
jgi:TolB-like protein/Tfp pilus assembly protein PilF